MTIQVKAQLYTVSFEDLSRDGQAGQTDYDRKHIIINDTRELYKMKNTILHEVTHAFWHTDITRVQEIAKAKGYSVETMKPENYIAELVAIFMERNVLHVWKNASHLNQLLITHLRKKRLSETNRH